MSEHRSKAAIILAAGAGRRLGRLTADRPKCLLDVNGKTLIERQITSLLACGVRDITVVVGYLGEKVRAQLGTRVSYLANRLYRDTNSLCSLRLAREALARGALVLNADALVPTALIERLLRTPADDAALINRRRPLGPEEMKLKLWRDYAVDFGKELARADADGENVGIVKLGVEGGRRLIGCLSRRAIDERPSQEAHSKRCVKQFDADVFPSTDGSEMTLAPDRNSGSFCATAPGAFRPSPPSTCRCSSASACRSRKSIGPGRACGSSTCSTTTIPAISRATSPAPPSASSSTAWADRFAQNS